MTEIDQDLRRQMDIRSAYMGINYTEEQYLLASDFTKSRISFSDPGSGKTQTILLGLMMAELYHRVPGNRILAFSFTKAATADLSNRYDEACKKCLIKPYVNFKTFHKFCKDMLKEDMKRLEIREKNVWNEELPYLSKIFEDEGYFLEDFWKLKKVLICMNKLNSSLVFDERSIIQDPGFKELDLPVTLFQKVRKRIFLKGILSENITQGDIPLCALYKLLTNQRLREKYREMYDVVVVDEFQDMSVLHLKILSLVTKNLVAVGDIKQQIYGFNGASTYIVDEYLKTYKDAEQINLTTSFRCKEEISQFATRVVKPNFKDVKPFTCVRGDGGTVQQISSKELRVSEIIRTVKAQQDKKESTKSDVMFLFRNNITVNPILEEMYKQDVLFRVNKFSTVQETPIFECLCKYVHLAIDSRNFQVAKFIPMLFPEFRRTNEHNCPLIQAMQMSSTDIFTVDFKYREQSSIDIVQALYKTRALYLADKSASVVLNSVRGLWEKFVIENNFWKLDEEPEFYYDLVAPILKDKLYDVMIEQEKDKKQKNIDNNNAGVGIQCFTMHSCKGLEANDVYLIDTDDGIFPNDSIFDKMRKRDCLYSNAKSLREERNLLYVALTRAKNNVFISYLGKVTELISCPENNKYSELDTVYEAYDNNFDDVNAFLELIGGAKRYAGI